MYHVSWTHVHFGFSIFYSLGVLQANRPFSLINDEDFDSAKRDYLEAIELLVSKGYNEDPDDSEAEDPIDIEDTVCRFAQNVVGPEGPSVKIGKIFFPQYAYDLANDWRGNHVKPLNDRKLDEKAKTAEQCMTMVNDPRILVGDKVSCSRLFNFSINKIKYISY